MAYHNLHFQSSNLRMPGAKTTCKDRWRQILSEANRIKIKHLITIQPAISEDQTAEMMDKKIQLIVPKPLHPTFTSKQQEWILGFDNFITELKKIST